MTDQNIPLETLQRWMMSVITHPAGIESAIDSETARKEIGISSAEVESVISPSQSCSSIERLQVYGNAYFARLLECLQAEFPAVQHAVGEKAFASFAQGYVQAYPPGSYTLNALGKFFPAYLAQTRPQTDAKHGWEDFVIELAIVERVFSEVFDGPGEEGQSLLTAAKIQSIPPDKWSEMQILTSESLRLCSCQFPVQEYIQAVRDGKSPSAPEPVPTWLVVHRVNYVVRRHATSEVQWRLLRALQQGHPLTASIQLAMDETDTEMDVLVSELGNWFRDWTAAGYFRGIAEADRSTIESPEGSPPSRGDAES